MVQYPEPVIVKIEGYNINLCPITESDDAISEYTKWFNDNTMVKYIREHDFIVPKHYIKDWVHKNSDNMLNIVLANSSDIIGLCKIEDLGGRSYELSIIIGEVGQQQKGYGTETLTLLIDWLFNSFNAHRIQLNAVEDNKKALNCYTKSGFKKYGIEHSRIFYDGSYHDNILLEITEEMYMGDK